MRRIVLAFIAALATACGQETYGPEAGPRLLELTDPASDRAVPVVLYGATGPDRPLALIFHGHGGAPDDYDYIAAALVARGFVVASIDHELPGDPPLRYEGNIVARRTPLWRQGVASALLVIRELGARSLADFRTPVVVIGHSHGGDIAMTMAADHPRLVRAAISLDHLRQPMPRRSQPRLCSIRSSEFSADPGVIPTEQEAQLHGIRITRPPDLPHGRMNDTGSPAQNSVIVAAIDRCLS